MTWAAPLAVFPLIENHTLSLISIPVFGGIIGYVINWTGVWMLYRPLAFVGFRVPGLARVMTVMPARLHEIPGLAIGRVGWQGLLPARAGRLGSIATDTQIAKIGTPAEFYQQLDLDDLAEHIARDLDDDLRRLVDEVLAEHYPELWAAVPDELRERLQERVREQLPTVARQINTEIGRHVDQLVDVRLMVVRLLQENPFLTNRLFHEVGRKEFRFIINFGFVFGFLLGLPTILLVEAVPQWWVLPVAESVIGAVTNWIGIWLIYEPVRAKRIGPWRWQGLFLRRQHEASATYAEVIAHEVVTVSSFARELMHGPRSDRTRELLRRTLRPLVDAEARSVRPALETAYGSGSWSAARDAIVERGAEMTLEPLTDEQVAARQNTAIQHLVTERMRELPPEDFSETMRAATREDEWLLIAHGVAFGFIGGAVHYLIFGL
jgi:uncharacterized membrane protein YheB (UPF0754 family)